MAGVQPMLLPVFRSSQVVIETAAPGDSVLSEERDDVQAYFTHEGPDWVWKVLIVGLCSVPVLALAFWAGVPRSLFAYPALLGSMVFVVAAMVEARAMRREATVDEVLQRDLARATEYAFERLQIAKPDLIDRNCCAFFGQYDDNGDYGKSIKKSMLGKDERTRWTPREVTSVYVGRDRLWLHSSAIDLTTGASLYERMREIKFADIVSVVLYSKTTTRPMPKKHSKAVKASRYWSTRGGVVREDSLQIPGEQMLSLELASGGTPLIATWEGARDNIEPADAVSNREAALRLRAWVEDAKRAKPQPQAPGVGPVVRVTSGYGQPPN